MHKDEDPHKVDRRMGPVLAWPTARGAVVADCGGGGGGSGRGQKEVELCGVGIFFPVG